MLNLNWMRERIIIFLLILIIFLPPAFLSGGYTFHSLIIIETLIVFAGVIWSLGRIRIIHSKVNLPVLCYILSCLLSTINTYYLRGTWEEIIKLGCGIFFFLMIGNYFSTRLKLLAQIFILTTLIVVFFSLVQFFTHLPESLSHRLFYPLCNPNILSGFLVITIPLILRIVWLVKFRFLLGILLLFSFMTLFFTYSRGGLLGVIGAILFIFFINPRIKRNTCYILITGLLIIAGALIVWFNYFSPRAGSFIDYQRLHIWKYSFQMFLDHPMLGVGLGAYPNVYFEYKQQPQWHLHSHNIFLQHSCELGIIGLFCFTWILIILVKENLGKINNNYENGVREGLLASLIGLLVHGQVDYLLWLPVFGIYFWLIVSILSSDEPVKGYVCLSSKFSWFMGIMLILFWFLCILKPFLGYVYFNQGVELADKGKWIAAKVKFEKAVLFDFYHPLYHAHLGLTYTKTQPQNLALAIKEYKTAHQLDRYNPQISSNLTYLAPSPLFGASDFTRTPNTEHRTPKKGLLGVKLKTVEKKDTLSWKLYRRMPMVEFKIR